MRICDTYGAGFFFIPGSDTCLRIGGYVRFEGYFGERFNAASSVYATRARVLLNFDARSNTEYGLLRSYGEFHIQRGSATNSSPLFVTGATGYGVSGQASAATLTRAFVQFAGFTAGHSASFFNFYQDDLRMTSSGGAGHSTSTGTNLLAYTASFGSGLSATVSLEDPQYRRVGAQTTLATAATGVVTITGPQQINGVVYNGQGLPDIVANLRIDQGWGSAQIMGAIHEVRTTVTTNGADNGGVALASPGDRSKFGWAVGAGIMLNLNMIARGDVLWLQAVYSDGALNYAWSQINSDSIPASRNTFTVKGIGISYADGVVNATGTGILTSKSWAIHGGFRHFWTPAVRSAIFASYVSVDAPTTGAALGSNLRDFNTWFAGVNTIWSPVRNLDLGVEIMYQSINRRVSAVGGGTAANTAGSAGAWSGGIRVQRNF